MSKLDKLAANMMLDQVRDLINDKVEYVQEEVDVLDKCIWCGKSYGEHLDSRGLNEPVPRVPCTLLKSGFKSKQKDLSQ